LQEEGKVILVKVLSIKMVNFSFQL